MNIRIVTLVTLATFLSACSSTPARNSALEQANEQYQAAQKDPKVLTLAADELRQAAQSLNTAEKAWKDKEKKATVDHLAYLAKQRVVIAQETATSKEAQAITANAAANRDQTRLAVRTNEADTAKRQLAAADAAAQAEEARSARRETRINDLETQLQELNAVKTDRGIVVTLGDVLFNTGKSQLLPEGKRNMVKLADFFKRNPQVTATIVGYTDSVGAADFNLRLSQQRATSAMMELVYLGVERERLVTHGYGEENPVASNQTADGRKLNRRVEVVFPQTN